MRWLFFIMLAGCSMGSPWDNDCDWTWLEEEGCLMDTCEGQLLEQERDHSWSECRLGECWCCSDAPGGQSGGVSRVQCWFSGRVFKAGSPGDS